MLRKGSHHYVVTSLFLLLPPVCSYWDEGQPDNWDYRVNGEDCGQLHGSTRRKRKMWNDADCSMQYRYICEARA